MPSEWRNTTLGALLSFANGKTSPERDEHGKYEVFGSNGSIGRANTTNAPGNTIIVGRVGSYCGSLHYSPGSCWVTDNAIRATAIDGNDPRFLLYLLQTLNLNNWRSGSGQPLLNQSILSSIPTAVPGVLEQRGIASALGALDDKIALLRATNATLEAIAQALFKSWFVDFDPVRAKAEGRDPEGVPPEVSDLFPSEFQDSALGEIPKGWRVGSVGVIADVIDCLHAKKPELLPTGKPFLQLSNIRDDGLLDLADVSAISEADYTKWTSRIEVSQGDCVITNVGRVGAVSQIPPGFRGAMGRNMTAIRPKPDFPYPTYLVELLQSTWMRGEIERLTDVGTILNALNVKSIPLLRCALSPHTVLNAFEDLCRPLRASMEHNLRRADALAGLRDTLLPRLMSGKLRIPEIQENMEEATA